MLSSLLVSVAFSITASAGPALSVVLTGANSVTSRSNSVIFATVTNTGDGTVRVLNHPSTVLSNGPTDVFTVSSSAGKAPRFHGLFVKYLPSPKKTFTTIQPGHSVTVKHSLADAYDFSESGAGTYMIKPSSVFYVVTDDGVKTLTADVVQHSAVLSGAIVKPGRPAPSLVPVENCSIDEQKAIHRAASAADGLVHESVHAILGQKNTTRYITWFGAYSARRYNVVAARYTALIQRSFVQNTSYTCVAFETCVTHADSEAFTGQYDQGHIWICPDFFSVPPIGGADSQAGILLNLATHWAGDISPTQHWAFGQQNCAHLAQNLPDFAVENADNYEYYSENVPSAPDRI